MFTNTDMQRGMDGVRLAAAIRDRWPPIEIILTSWRVAIEDGHMPPCSMFSAKLYEVEKVVETLQRMVG